MSLHSVMQLTNAQTWIQQVSGFRRNSLQCSFRRRVDRVASFGIWVQREQRKDSRHLTVPAELNFYYSKWVINTFIGLLSHKYRNNIARVCFEYKLLGDKTRDEAKESLKKLLLFTSRQKLYIHSLYECLVNKSRKT